MSLWTESEKTKAIFSFFVKNKPTWFYLFSCRFLTNFLKMDRLNWKCFFSFYENMHCIAGVHVHRYIHQSVRPSIQTRRVHYYADVEFTIDRLSSFLGNLLDLKSIFITFLYFVDFVSGFLLHPSFLFKWFIAVTWNFQSLKSLKYF